MSQWNHVGMIVAPEDVGLGANYNTPLLFESTASLGDLEFVDETTNETLSEQEILYTFSNFLEIPESDIIGAYAEFKRNPYEPIPDVMTGRTDSGARLIPLESRVQQFLKHNHGSYKIRVRSYSVKGSREERRDRNNISKLNPFIRTYINVVSQPHEFGLKIDRGTNPPEIKHVEGAYFCSDLIVKAYREPPLISEMPSDDSALLPGELIFNNKFDKYLKNFVKLEVERSMDLPNTMPFAV